jgi:murein DD-endopeptidase MepM/ murein hydrolase activator NlpD
LSKAALLFLVVALLVLPVAGVRAQDQPQGPVYIVQEGDSLWEIAQRFGVSVDDLVQTNSLVDPNQVAAGTALVIPGLPGLQGVLTTRTVQYGETLRSLSRLYHLSSEDLARLNHLATPAELYAGYNLVMPVSDGMITGTQRTMLVGQQSLIELSVLNQVNPWEIVGANTLSGTWSALPNDVFLLPEGSISGLEALPAEIAGLEIEPSPLAQGKTAVIALKGAPGLTLGGSLLNHTLNFFDNGEAYIALQGVHAMTESGLYPLTITGTLQDTTSFTFTQKVYVRTVDYPYDQPLTVSPTTIDPAVTRPEDAQWNALVEPVSPDKLWLGVFKLPSPLDAGYCLETGECWSSRFGNRRSYNGSPYNAFHTGLDIVGGSGTQIYAPAPGIVVFAGPLTVRGNATMIDHGRGVYSGYMHQSEVYVQPGQRVNTGDLIGLVGGTGRVEGPHLHWELWVNGVQVDPIDWLVTEYP